MNSEMSMSTREMSTVESQKYKIGLKGSITLSHDILRILCYNFTQDFIGQSHKNILFHPNINRKKQKQLIFGIK